MPEEIMTNKKVALIVAFRDFRDEEYFLPKEVLQDAKTKVLTVSDDLGVAVGIGGGEAEVDVLIGDLKIEDFDAIVFIGGPGALPHLDSEESYRIAKETVKAGKILGAICISSTILAKADVLRGKRATVWSSSLDKSSVKVLKENGAIYEDKDVVVDGKIITANGPGAAREFGEKLVELLK